MHSEIVTVVRGLWLAGQGNSGTVSEVGGWMDDEDAGCRDVSALFN